MSRAMTVGRRFAPRRRIGTRSTVAIAAMLVPLVAASAAGIVAVRQGTARFENSYRETLDEHRPLATLRSSLPDIGIAAMATATGSTSLARYRQMANGAEATFRSMLQGGGADDFVEERADVARPDTGWRTPHHRMDRIATGAT